MHRASLSGMQKGPPITGRPFIHRPAVLAEIAQQKSPGDQDRALNRGFL